VSGTMYPHDDLHLIVLETSRLISSILVLCPALRNRIPHNRLLGVAPFWQMLVIRWSPGRRRRFHWSICSKPRIQFIQSFMWQMACHVVGPTSANRQASLPTQMLHSGIRQTNEAGPRRVHVLTTILCRCVGIPKWKL